MAEKVVKIVFEIDGVEKVVNSIEEYEKEVKKAGEATEKAGEKQGFFAKRAEAVKETLGDLKACLLYTSPSPRDRTRPRMPSSA